MTTAVEHEVADRTPEEWPRVQLRRLATIKNGGTPTSEVENWDGGVPFVTPPDLRRYLGKVVEETGRTLTFQGAASGSTLTDGGVIVSTRAPIGYVARLEGRCAFNQGCRVLETHGIEDRFLTYSLLSQAPVLQELGQGTTFMELSSGSLANVRIAVPNLHIQVMIADYLDRQTIKVDALISKLQALIDRLQERMSALIASTVTQDGTPLRIKDALSKLQRRVLPESEVVTAYRNGQVTTRSRRREEGYTFSESESGYQGVHSGDLVFHALDGFAGAVGVADSEGKCSPVYHVCKTTEAANPRFMAYLLRALGAGGLLTAYAWSVRQRSVDYRNWALFANLPICLPSVDVQCMIAAHLDRELARIGEVIRRSERMIELSKERRSALITAAVTGQIDVAEMKSSEETA